MATTTTLAALPELVGQDLGASSWIDITQERVNTFADATDDQQWIHVDPERAKDGPFGAAIAHGFLTLSLSIPLWTELLDVTDAGTKVNYGLNKVRFLSPVKVGSRIRLQATIADVEEVKGGLQITIDMTMEIEGAEKPAAIAQAIHRFYA
ncbi:MaoC family dehydratase [Salinibacterium hongtaonis]|uniref:MaoC family dehydratase n=1 Tax=Homoserinimonas hongtaonis TaxID=2079791 RepID=A0A2U1SZM2_9MICO|nr:MaoC family dehydratase [Salinibacterium hongtaonis]AWB89633.1 enoyl-CoA hydratase [Salinibacterium hongtaonis]PWB97085.1 MaoC family dehydratase [Salinibacterium hongtaonis]